MLSLKTTLLRLALKDAANSISFVRGSGRASPTGGTAGGWQPGRRKRALLLLRPPSQPGFFSPAAESSSPSFQLLRKQLHGSLSEMAALAGQCSSPEVCLSGPWGPSSKLLFRLFVCCLVPSTLEVAVASDTAHMTKEVRCTPGLIFYNDIHCFHLYHLLVTTLSGTYST